MNKHQVIEKQVGDTELFLCLDGDVKFTINKNQYIVADSQDNNNIFIYLKKNKRRIFITYQWKTFLSSRLNLNNTVRMFQLKYNNQNSEEIRNILQKEINTQLNRISDLLYKELQENRIETNIFDDEVITLFRCPIPTTRKTITFFKKSKYNFLNDYFVLEDSKELESISNNFNIKIIYAELDIETGKFFYNGEDLSDNYQYIENKNSPKDSGEFIDLKKTFNL